VDDGKYTNDQMRAVEDERNSAQQRQALSPDVARKRVMKAAAARRGK